ncbi:MAG TPA: tetratricopeptide repeat protein [Bryobacteraceae bacterium]
MQRLILAFIWVLGSVSLISQVSPGTAGKIPDLERRIQQHLQEQKPELAIPLLRELVSIDQTNSNAQANLGVLLFFGNRYAEAIPCFRAALSLQPDLAKIQALLGIAEKRTGDAAKAQKDLAASFAGLADRKIRLQAGLELIEIYQAASHLSEAQSVAAVLEAFDPQNPQLLFVSHQLARQMMDQTLLSLMLAAPDSAEMHMVIAGESARQGDHTNAIANYRDAIRLNPMMAGAHFQLAEQLRTAPDPALNAQAEGEYRAALRVSEFDEPSWRQLAVVLAAKGDTKAAEEDYRRAISLRPVDSDAETGLAGLLSSLNRSDEAIPFLESAVKHDPTNSAAHYRLSTLYRRAGRAEEAEREMDSFRRYQALKDKLGKTFRELAAPAGPQ